MAKKKAFKKEQVSESKRPLKAKSQGGFKFLTSREFLLGSLIFIGIFIGTYLFYSSTIEYDLVYCDDNIFVLDYKKYNADPENITKAFERTIGASYYRPVLSASFVVDYQMGETDVSVYRRTNVFLHALGSSLVFLFLMMMGYELIPALIFSALFAVHPILTPAASWISGRNDSLISVFILLAFVFQILYYNAKKIYSSAIFYLLHILMFFLSLFTKEIAVMLPFVSLIYSVYYRKDKLLSAKNISLGISWSVLLLIWFIMRKAATENIASADEIGITAIFKNIASVPAMIGKIFLPVNMNALSNYEPFSIISGIVIIIILTLVIILSKNITFNKILPGLAWFILFIGPTLLVRIVYVDDFFDYAEHRAYLPMIGIFLILIEIMRSYKIDFKKPIVLIISGIMIIGFGYRSLIYEPTFRDRTTFWQHQIDLYPEKARGYLDLGKAYYMHNKLDSAEILYVKGLELNPDNFNLHIDLSAVYIRKEKFNKAQAHAKRALELSPNQFLAHYNLARALVGLKRFSEAVPHYEKAVKVRPLPSWIVDLGIAYFHSNELDKAIATFNGVLNRDPNNSVALTNLGAAYASKKLYKDAETIWLKALALNPSSKDVHENLIRLYLLNGDIDKAKEFKTRFERIGGKLSPNINMLD